MSYYKNNNPERYTEIHKRGNFGAIMTDGETIVLVDEDHCRIASRLELDTLRLVELLECEPKNPYEKEAREKLESFLISFLIKAQVLFRN